jgi:hypothetical protein
VGGGCMVGGYEICEWVVGGRVMCECVGCV